MQPLREDKIPGSLEPQTQFPSDPAIPLLGVYPRIKLVSTQKSCTRNGPDAAEREHENTRRAEQTPKAAQSLREHEAREKQTPARLARGSHGAPTPANPQTGRSAGGSAITRMGHAQKRPIHRDIEWVHACQEERGMERNCLTGTEFPSGMMKTLLEFGRVW